MTPGRYENEPIRVLIADDDPLVRLGLSDLLGTDETISVVAAVADGHQAVEVARAKHVDVALVDIRMPVLDGIQTTTTLSRLADGPRILILTTFALDEYVYQALTAGADGFLVKDTNPGEILRAIHQVASGSGFLHPVAARAVIDRFHRTSPAVRADAQHRIKRLTPREQDVLKLLAIGDSNADIARTLRMRESTVKAHVSRILSGLDVANRVQAAILARDAM